MKFWGEFEEILEGLLNSEKASSTFYSKIPPLDISFGGDFFRNYGGIPLVLALDMQIKFKILQLISV